MEGKVKQPKVQISRDGLEATITFAIPEGGAPHVDYAPNQLIAILNGAGVTFGIDQDVISRLSDSLIYQKPVVVARGYSCEQGTPGYFEYLFETKLTKKPVIRDDGTTDYMNMKTIETVEKGEAIAVYHGAVQGTSGMSVRGTIIPPKPVRDLPPLTGRGFDRDPDNITYRSQIDGKIEVQQGRVIISPVHEVNGDADVTTGNIDFNGDVVVNGGAHDGVIIKAAGNVTIKGLVENCEIYAGRDVFLMSGTKGGEKTIIESGGSLTAQFMEYVVVNCGGNITADYLFKSKVSCDGKIELTGKKSSIIGGFVSAVQGIEVEEVGNSFGTITNVAAGVDSERVAAIDRMKNQIEAINSNVTKIKKGLEVFETLGQERGVDYSNDPRRLQLLRVKIRDEAVILKNRESLTKMENVIKKGENATIKVFRNVYAGVNITIDDHHTQITDNYNGIEFSKTEIGVRMDKI